MRGKLHFGQKQTRKSGLKFSALPLIVAASAFAAFGLGATASSAATVNVTTTNMGDWAFNNRDNSSPVRLVNANSTAFGGMVTGPATPPLGTGSAELATGNGTTGGDGSEELRNTFYNGTKLNTITALSYSTYVTANDGTQFPYLLLRVSRDGSGINSNIDFIYFRPDLQTPMTGNSSLSDQGSASMDTWQTWDALDGGWLSNDSIASGAGGAFSSPSTVDTLAAYLALYPDATIENRPDGLGGLRFTVGFQNPTDQFVGYTDNFTIGVNGVNTTYNFEAASTTPLPATLPLFVTGLGALGLFGWGRRRKNPARMAA